MYYNSRLGAEGAPVLAVEHEVIGGEELLQCPPSLKPDVGCAVRGDCTLCDFLDEGACDVRRELLEAVSLSELTELGMAWAFAEIQSLVAAFV